MQDHKLSPVVVTAGSGDSYSVANNSYRIIISGAQTNGAYAVIEMLVPPGGGPGPHAHPSFQESFYVMKGTVDVTSEAGQFTAETGAFVNIPQGGIVHCFKNNSSEPATLICTVVPAGLEEFFAAIGQAAPFGTFVDTKPMTATGMEELKATAAKFGQTLFPPDYFG